VTPTRTARLPDRLRGGPPAAPTVRPRRRPSRRRGPARPVRSHPPSIRDRGPRARTDDEPRLRARPRGAVRARTRTDGAGPVPHHCARGAPRGPPARLPLGARHGHEREGLGGAHGRGPLLGRRARPGDLHLTAPADGPRTALARRSAHLRGPVRRGPRRGRGARRPRGHRRPRPRRRGRRPRHLLRAADRDGVLVVRRRARRRRDLRGRDGWSVGRHQPRPRRRRGPERDRRRPPRARRVAPRGGTREGGHRQVPEPRSSPPSSRRRSTRSSRRRSRRPARPSGGSGRSSRSSIVASRSGDSCSRYGSGSA
jgi:hypothetical protein